MTMTITECPGVLSAYFITDGKLLWQKSLPLNLGPAATDIFAGRLAEFDDIKDHGNFVPEKAKHIFRHDF